MRWGGQNHTPEFRTSVLKVLTPHIYVRMDETTAVDGIFAIWPLNCASGFDDVSGAVTGWRGNVDFLEFGDIENMVGPRPQMPRGAAAAWGLPVSKLMLVYYESRLHTSKTGYPSFAHRYWSFPYFSQGAHIISLRMAPSLFGFRKQRRCKAAATTAPYLPSPSAIFEQTSRWEQLVPQQLDPTFPMRFEP